MDRDEYQMDTIKPWVCPDGPQVGKDGSQVGTHRPQVGTEEFSSGGFPVVHLRSWVGMLARFCKRVTKNGPLA